MRKIPLPQVDDAAALNRLAKSWAKDAVAISAAHPVINAQYTSYEAAGGDPWIVNANPTITALRPHLEKLYDKPLAAIKHIKNLRDSLDGACPMCGRDALGTLDHYLPQADYPEFCFFSKNLIPACNRCNSARSNQVKGDAQGKRALQPYFDAFASQRVMTIELSPDWRAPIIEPVPFNVHGDARLVVEWQIENVVKPSGFVEYASPIWATLANQPLEIFPRISTMIAVREKLVELERSEIAMSKSQNAWRSCIYHGIQQNQAALLFLANQVHQAINGTL